MADKDFKVKKGIQVAEAATIGTTTPSVITESGIDRADAVDQTFTVQNSGAGSITLQVVGTLSASTIVETSDVALKENIKSLQDALAVVLGLRGIEFNYIEKPEQREIGFVAQEVQAVAPDLVRNENGVLKVQYSRATALLVEAIKKQQEQIDTLSKRIKNLENNGNPTNY